MPWNLPSSQMIYLWNRTIYHGYVRLVQGSLPNRNTSSTSNMFSAFLPGISWSHKFNSFLAGEKMRFPCSLPKKCLPPNQILQEESTSLLKTSQQDTAGPKRIDAKSRPLDVHLQQHWRTTRSRLYNRTLGHFTRVCMDGDGLLPRFKTTKKVPQMSSSTRAAILPNLSWSKFGRKTTNLFPWPSWNGCPPRAIGYQLGRGAFAQLCRSSSALCGYPQGKSILVDDLNPSEKYESQ